MKFALKWKLQKLRKRKEKPTTSKSGTSGAATNTTPASLATANARKQLIIRSTCADFVAQLELLHTLHNDDSQPKILAKSTRENFCYNGSFHEAVSKVILMAEFFAFMPVKGITAPHPRQMSFAWSNVRSVYCLVFIIMTLIDLGLTLYKVLNRPITFNSIEPIIFRASIVLACASALSLARKWPQLMVFWYEVECDLPQYFTQMDKRRMAYSIKIVTFAVMALSLAEHLLSIITYIIFLRSCAYTEHPIEGFFIMTNQQIFTLFSYSHWLAAWGKTMNVLMTFIWNYMDVFVMIISIGLSSTFKRLNDNLVKFKGMQMPEVYWAERRVQYRNICILCERVDNAISVITMICFSNNLYFICVQMLRSLNKRPSFSYALYFYFSLLFLIGRTLAVSLYSAKINDESLKPLRIIRCVPKESWCAEVKRFAEDISSDLVALSGMKFFHLTRKIVLSVAGTIVTYELVLIQFHQDTRVWDCSQYSNGSNPH